MRRAPDEGFRGQSGHDNRGYTSMPEQEDHAYDGTGASTSPIRGASLSGQPASLVGFGEEV